MNATNMCGATNPHVFFNTNDQQPSTCNSIDGETPHFDETVNQYERVPECNVAQILKEAALKDNALDSCQHSQCLNKGNDSEQNGKKVPYNQPQSYESQRISHCDLPLQTISSKSMVEEQIHPPTFAAMESIVQPNLGKKRLH